MRFIVLLILFFTVGYSEILQPDLISRFDKNNLTVDTDETFPISSSVQRKFFQPVIGENNENAVYKSNIDDINRKFKIAIENVKRKTKRVDIVFLIDSSSSVGKTNFISETKFVKKLLSDFNVSYNYTRVALVTFSSQGKVIKHIDQISNPVEENDKCKLLNDDIPKIEFVAGGTYTYGALEEAKNILSKARKNSKKIVFLVTDGYSNGRDPIPLAMELKNGGVTVFTIGIESGNYIELYNMSSSPEEDHSFLLDSFAQFESLARKALHSDYRIGQNWKLNNHSRCSGLCDNINEGESCCDSHADCTCGTSSGHYACQCEPGYYGSGLKDQCFLCPNGTYWHNSNMCRPCPDINHITVVQPALDVSYCVCKTGFKLNDDNRCEGITCPKLSPPENGYFVKQPTNCANVLHAACGARCKSGYQLTGTSLRLCQENGTWSGTEATCALKTCTNLSVPYYGFTVCRNKDLGLFFDYSTRNATFMKFYENEATRITEPMPIDTDCTFKCGIGQYLVGSRSRTCLPLAKWDGLQTICKQVLCAPLPKPTYGEYELSDCVDQKVPYRTNCTLKCPEGFTVRGPQTKMCAGKKNGIWTHKSKNAKCVDITPPTITCPKDLSVFVNETSDFTIMTTLPIPTNLSDSSGRNVTYWLKQTVNNTDGVKLNIGNHSFIYIASDSFNNKANCSFTVQVLDKIPPVVENCVDPDEFRVTNAKTEFIEWEEPTFFDNSNMEVLIEKSLSPGILGAGRHIVVYTGTDKFNNSMSCTMNISVKEIFCEPLKAPLNGNILCARNTSYTWCEIICNPGFAIFDGDRDEYKESLNVTCLNASPDWKYETTPDCTPLELPNSVEQILTIPMESDAPMSNCENETARTQLQQILVDHLKRYMCNDLEDCDLISQTPPECNNDVNDLENIDNEILDKTYYKIVKREIPQAEPKKTKAKQKYNVRIKLYTRIGRKLGVWQKGKTFVENMQKVRNELHSTAEGNVLKRRLQDLSIDIRKFKIEEFLKCPDGSIFKRSMCVQCPRGTFHDALFNRCVMCPIGTYNSQMGQILCTNCPPNASTRKSNRRHSEDCIQQCPPGTIAKIKIPRKKSRPDVQNMKSLMPFCRKCNPGEYQSAYDQTQCERCPFGYTSPRGATSLSDCVPEKVNPCRMDSNVCGRHGECTPDPNDGSLYYCQCEFGYDGPHCEHMVDLCISAPCYNSGLCRQFNSSSFTCFCPPDFTGPYCEEARGPCHSSICQNGGICLEVAGSPSCECPLGFDGAYCEKKVDHCRYNNLCENGRCENAADGYQCKCPPGIIGKRCHLRPCDYMPCHRNAICLDLPHYPATQESYMCKCPVGLKGYDCSQPHSPCDVRPCRNNGACFPKALRTVGGSDLDDEKYREYDCKCPPYFYGKNCEVLVTPDFYVKFAKPSTTNFIKLDGPEKDLNEISFCVWLQTNDSFNYGTLLSYATLDMDNMVTFTDYNGFVLYIHGQHIVTDIIINDGVWHFICTAWTSKNGYFEIYLDGKLHQTGLNLSTNSVIEKGGVLIVGQEQDQLNGDFSESESFVGSIAYLDIWDNFITAAEVKEFYSSCEPYRGNLYAWTDFKVSIQGSIEVLPSNFCQECDPNLHLANGRVNIVQGKAFYQCDDGYKLQGNVMRKCLRTSDWSQEIPVCQIVTCQTLVEIPLATIAYDRLTYGGFARYKCQSGYILDGNEKRVCLSNGEWSGVNPLCISKARCPQISLLSNATITYGSESGPLISTLSEYDVGSFAEVICYTNGLMVESILICMENGEWDNKVPLCALPASSTTAIVSTATTTSSRPILSSHLPNIYRFAFQKTNRPTTRRNLTLLTTSTPKVFPTNKTIITTTTVATTSPDPTTTSTSTSTTNLTTKPATTTTTEIPTTSSTPPSTTSRLPETEASLMSTQRSTISRIPSVSAIDYPSKNFWMALKSYLFNGCSRESKNIPELCLYSHPASNIRNLTKFDPPKSNEYRNIDVKLFNLLKDHIDELDEVQLTFEKFFEFILYGASKEWPSKKLSDKMEDYLRFILCFYIDTIMWDNSGSKLIIEIDEESTDDINSKLKSLIIRTAIPVYKDYLQRRNENNSEESTLEENHTDVTTEIYKSTTEVQHCNLKNVPEEPANGVIIKVLSATNQTILAESTDIRENSILAPLGTKVYYSCKDGTMIVESNNIAVCEEGGIWTTVRYSCKEMFCDKPPQPVSMNREGNSSRKFKFGDKIRLHCNEGYVLHGNPEIVCNDSGKWSKVLARCAKISCNKPKLPSNAEIIKGRSYLYEDKVTIECDDGEINEMVCQINGKWSSDVICS